MDYWYSLPWIAQPLSSASHLCGAILFATLTYFLLQQVRRDRAKFWSLAVFAASAVLLLTMSGIYHMFALGGPGRAIMLRLDVAAIFILIAGSFTPLHGALFTGWKRWGVLTAIWTIAVVGITLRTVYFESISKAVGATFFLLMGWLALLSAYLLWRSHQRQYLAALVCGGVLYSFGAISNVVGWPVVIPYIWGPHETLHFAVLGGLSCHWYVAWCIAGSATTSISQRLLVDQGDQANVVINEAPPIELATETT